MFSIVVVSNVSSFPAPDKHVHRQEEYQIKQNLSPSIQHNFSTLKKLQNPGYPKLASIGRRNVQDYYQSAPIFEIQD